MRVLALIALAVVTTLSACASVSAPTTRASRVGSAAADHEGLARTPPMGWNPWNAYGCRVSARLIEQTARTMVADGMKAAGYEYVNIDDCWPAAKRDASGRLAPDPSRFPDGIRSVANYVHRLGLKLGIYTDAGTSMCGGTAPGSYRHEAKDAATFASWGVDYVKYDACNIPFHNFPGETREQVYRTLYKRMSGALVATRRPIVFAMCNGWDPAAHPWSWGAAISNLWRTTADIADSYLSMLSNFDGNVHRYRYAGPGHWNDPDMLEVGNDGESTLEYQTEFSLWSEMAAPLIAGTNIAHLSRADLAIYENRQVIAVDQDPLGRQGVPVAGSHGLWVLSKRLADGSRSVVLFNSTDTAAPIATTAAAVGLPKSPIYQLRDLWTGDASETGGRISAFVSPHGVAMYRIAPVSGELASGVPPDTVLSLVAGSPQLRAGDPTTVMESFTNNGVSPVQQVRMSFVAPSGWSARPLGAIGDVAVVGPGRTATASFRVTAPAANAPLAIADLAGAVTYGVDGRAGTSTATLGETLLSELTAPWAAADTTGAAAIYGHFGSAYAIKSSGTGVGSRSISVIPPIAATDSYAAIYRKRAAGSMSTAKVTVTSNAGLGPWAGAGLIERRAMDAPTGSPETITLFIDWRGAIGMAWNRTGRSRVDSAVRLALALRTPVALKLVRSERRFTGYYSVDGGSRWIKVQTVTVAARAAAGRLDVGMFHASGSGRFATEAGFADFGVS